MTIVLALVVAGCVLLTLYPYLLYPLLLARLPRVPLMPPAPGAEPKRFALFLCAHNEAAVLPETLANLRRIKAVWPELAIYAYCDASTDGTFALLRGAGDILTPLRGGARAGKAAGMARLIGLGREDVLIFMDANVHVDPVGLHNVKTYFDRPDVGAVAGTLHYVNAGESVAAHVGGLYWRMEERIKRLESETGSTMGADGALFAVRRALYPAVAPDLQDDFLASMQALFCGLRCVSAPDVRAFERATVRSADEFRRKRRIACGAYATHRAMADDLRTMSALDRFKYVSHKVLRWYGGFFVLGGALAAFALAARLGVLVPFGAGLAALLVAGAGLALYGARPARTLAEILFALSATALGLLEAVAGGKYETWTPAGR